MMEWTPAKGLQWTCEKIFLHCLKDGNGTVHEPYGVMTWKASHYVHVCLDDHPFIGRRIHILPMAEVRSKVYEYAKCMEPTYGTLPKSLCEKTGAGFKMGVRDDGIFLLKEYKGKNISDLAVDAFCDYLISINRPFRRTSRHEQLSGMDIIALDGSNESYEIKSRDRSFEHVFVQISETNPEKRIK